MNNEENRTWCKYGNCSLEKLEFEFNLLNKIWTNLEENWAQPEDIEDVYRIYPLLDTTAALARKMLIYHGEKKKKYKVEIVKPTSRRTFDTTDYFYSGEHDFFNGNKEQCPLADVVSTCLHGSGYVYMDTRKNFDDKKGFSIYVLIETDRRRQYINVRSYIDSIHKLIQENVNKYEKTKSDSF